VLFVCLNIFWGSGFLMQIFLCRFFSLDNYFWGKIFLSVLYLKAFTIMKALKKHYIKARNMEENVRRKTMNSNNQFTIHSSHNFFNQSSNHPKTWSPTFRKTCSNLVFQL
jgi:hypothetical protein